MPRGQGRYGGYSPGMSPYLPKWIKWRPRSVKMPIRWLHMSATKMRPACTHSPRGSRNSPVPRPLRAKAKANVPSPRKHAMRWWPLSETYTRPPGPNATPDGWRRCVTGSGGPPPRAMRAASARCASSKWEGTSKRAGSSRCGLGELNSPGSIFRTGGGDEERNAASKGSAGS